MFGLFKELRKLLGAVSEQQKQQAQAIAALQSQLQATRQEVSRLAGRSESDRAFLQDRLQRADELQAMLSEQAAALSDSVGGLAAGQTAMSAELARKQAEIQTAIGESRKELVSLVSNGQSEIMQSLSETLTWCKGLSTELGALSDTIAGGISETRRDSERRHESTLEQIRTTAAAVHTSLEAARSSASEDAQAVLQQLEEVRAGVAMLQTGLGELAASIGQTFDRVSSLQDISDQIMPMNSQFFHLVSEIRGRVDEIGREMDDLIASNMAVAGRNRPSPSARASAPAAGKTRKRGPAKKAAPNRNGPSRDSAAGEPDAN